MGVFTREEEEVRVYDADAFWYFAATMLLVVLLPWSFYLISNILNPKVPVEQDWEAPAESLPKDAQAPSGARSRPKFATSTAVVRRCQTSQMEERRVRTKEVKQSWNYRLRSNWMGPQLVLAGLLWLALFATIQRVSNTPEQLAGFDPFAILDISSDASMSQIKKAYRQKSLAHHPDKDPNNPLAPALFQQISKAYAALTDETARANYEKYGNPDGPVQMKVGIALHPGIVGSKERQLISLSVFFVIIFGVPLSVVLCCLRGDRRAGGLSNETIRVFSAILTDEITENDGPSILATSTEVQTAGVLTALPDERNRGMKLLTEALAQKKPLPFGMGIPVEIKNHSQKEFKGRKGILRERVSQTTGMVQVFPVGRMPQSEKDFEMKEVSLADLRSIEPRLECLFSDQVVRRGVALLAGHMWRQHQHMIPCIQAELQQILQESDRLGRAMVSIASNRQGKNSSYETVQGLIRFQQRLTQALDNDSSPLLQLPHASESALQAAPAKALPTLEEVLSDKDGAIDKFCKLMKYSEQQKLDVQAFCRYLPRVTLDSVVEVADEADMAEGDLATMTITLTRTNVEEGEVMGPVHAPFRTTPKYEEWWILVYDHAARRFVNSAPILGLGRTQTCTVRFMLPRCGEFKWTVKAMCNAYVGLDVETTCSFKVKKKSEVDRSIFVHPKDQHIRSFFEDLMEGMNPPEQDSESEEEDEPVPKKPPVGAAKAAEEEPQQKKNDDDSASDSGDDGELEGIFVRIKSKEGCPIFSEPDRGTGKEIPQIGSMRTGIVARGYTEKRPDNWMELALSNGAAWLKLDSSIVEELGGLMEQPLKTVVTTATPVWMVKKWLKKSEKPVSVDDIVALRDLDNERIRTMCEELVRQYRGEEDYAKLMTELATRSEKKKQRIAKALGYFNTANNCIWKVNSAGKVMGLQPDGNKISDNIEIVNDGKNLTLGGTFVLDESKGCPCIHWVRKDDPEKQWVWQLDRTLETRVRLGSAF
mmetsp:Transcript_1869/g.4293  ORF Transcript_1869/g.4293 Transcript_1869/m.4293 type:complete len:990 (+) Transcript_1869:216-3185(+)